MISLKKIAGISFFLMLLVLSGCQGSDKVGDNVIDDVPLDRRIGVIKSLGGVVTEGSGTHLLQLDDGNNILLKSVAINLDDAKYLNKMVELRGVTSYTNGGKSLMEVQNIDILDQNFVPNETKSSGWELYENSDLGFSIKVKSDYEQTESDDGVEFRKEVTPVSNAESNLAPLETELKPEEYIISLIATQKKEADLVSFLGLDSTSESSLLADGYKKSRVGTQSLSAYKKQMGEVISFFVEGEDYFYELKFESVNSTSRLAYENVFYEMVSGFTLNNPGSIEMEGGDGLESIDEPSFEEESNDAVEDEIDTGNDEPASVSVDVPDNFTVYESDTFDFSVGYPKSWYFAGTPPTEKGSLRHYDFSNQSFEEEDTKGIISLDVFGAGNTSGTKLNVNGKTIYKDSSGGNVSYFYEKDGQTYRISGQEQYQDTIMKMVSSIE